MNKYKKLVNNTFLFAIGTFGSKAISFLMLPVFTRALSTSEYGNLDIINTTVTLLAPLISFELVEAVFRFSMDETKSKAEVYTNALMFSFFMFLLFGLFYPLFYNIEIFRDYINYFYLILLLNIIKGQAKHFVRGLGKVKIFAASDILYTLSFVILSLFFVVKLRRGLEGYFFSMLFAHILSFGFVFIASKLYDYISIKVFNKNTIKNMVIYSVPLIPNVAMWWIVNSSDRYLLAYFLGLDATGIYSVAYRFPTIIAMIYSVFFSSWQMSAIEEYNTEKRNHFFSKVFSINSSLLLLCMGAFIIILKPFLSILVSEDFFVAWEFIPLLLLGVTFKSFASFLGVGYVTSKQTKGAFVTSLCAGATNIGLNILLIPVWGIQGASFSTMAAFLIFWLARIYHTRQFFTISFKVDVMYLSFLIIVLQCLLLYFNLIWLQFITLQLLLYSILFLLHYKNILDVAKYVGRFTFSAKQ